MACKVYFTHARRPALPGEDSDDVLVRMKPLLQRLEAARADMYKPLPRHPRAPVTKMYIEPDRWEEYFQSVDKRRSFETVWRACRSFLRNVKAQVLEVTSPAHESLGLVEGLVPANILADANCACHALYAEWTRSTPLLTEVQHPDPEPSLESSTAVVNAFYFNLRHVTDQLANINVTLKVVSAAMGCVRTKDEFGEEGALRTLLAALPTEETAPRERVESLCFVRERLTRAVETVHRAALKCIQDAPECKHD